jgi:Cyclin, N-terminal domain
MGKKDLKYKPAEQRTPVHNMASPLGTLSRPDFRDALRRVAMIIHQHIVKIERRFESNVQRDDGLFMRSMEDEFSDGNFITPTYKCTMVRVPMARPGMVYGLKLVKPTYEIPSEAEIYEFAHRLFKSVQLSSECSIVCVIYVERLMEIAKVPLLASTWRPIFMCGLLLASKVWQDLSSWNIEFATVYPQYSLDAINRLELKFVRRIKWELYISSSTYAKYYFALRSLVEKQDFRQRYNRMVGGIDNVEESKARKIEERTTQVKEEALMQLSRSM